MPDGSLAEPVPIDRDAEAADGGNDAGTVPIRDAGPDVSTTPIGTCEAPQNAGSVAGDTGNGTITVKGNCSEWVSFRATEDDNGTFGTGMKANIGLQPAGHDFDLYAFFDPARDAVQCSAPSGRSEHANNLPEEIELTWGEGTIANGSDDGRTIRILVQSTAEACPPGASWVLTIKGHQ